jgi:hypothetical protein
MVIEKVLFETGVYAKPCELFNDIKIGAIHCVGHSDQKTKPCKYCVSHKEENTFYLPVQKQTIPIVSEVLCNRPAAQLTIF